MRIVLVIFAFGLCALTHPLIAQKVNPVGTIWLRDNVYIDKAPALNIHYREYEYMLREFYKFNLDSLKYKVAAAPYFGYNAAEFINGLKPTSNYNSDSASYKVNQTSFVSWTNWIDFRTYLNSPAYNFYPVINISYDLAVKFCEWRTAMVQLSYSIMSTTQEDRQKYHKKIKYRLPTQEEWEFAMNKFSNSNNLCKSKPKKGEITPRIKAKGSCFEITNLSEMVADGKVVKGCSWKQISCQQDQNTTLNSEAPADWITFRCVCEVED